jgi:hypothetical protein
MTLLPITTHAPFSTVDPFTQVLLRLWQIVLAEPGVASVVRPANRIILTAGDGFNPIKQNVQPGDLPELIIEPTTSTDEQAKTSKAAETVQTWSMKIATNDLRINATDPATGLRPGAFPLRWALLKAMCAAGDKLGLDFVIRTRLTTTLSNTYDPVENRGTEGWTVLMTVTTYLEFAKLPDGSLAD